MRILALYDFRVFSRQTSGFRDGSPISNPVHKFDESRLFQSFVSFVERGRPFAVLAALDRFGQLFNFDSSGRLKRAFEYVLLSSGDFERTRAGSSTESKSSGSGAFHKFQSRRVRRCVLSASGAGVRGSVSGTQFGGGCSVHHEFYSEFTQI